MQKERFHNDLLPCEWNYNESQWCQSSGVLTFWPALASTQNYGSEDCLKVTASKCRDHKSDERCHRLTIESKPFLQFAARKFRLQGTLIDFAKPGPLVYRLSWQHYPHWLRHSTHVIRSDLDTKYRNPDELETWAASETAIKRVIHFKVRSSDNEFRRRNTWVWSKHFSLYFWCFFRFLFSDYTNLVFFLVLNFKKHRLIYRQ